MALSKSSRRNAFEAVHQFGHSEFWRIVHEQVYVVVLTVEFHKLRLEVLAHLREDPAKVIKGSLGQDAAAVLGNKDQMYVHQENAVSSVSNVA